MPWVTKEGRTVEEAQDAAVAAAGVSPADLEIEVVSEGAKGLFGLGGEPAVVRVRPRGEATDVRHAFRGDIAPVQQGRTPDQDVTPDQAQDSARDDTWKPEPEDQPADAGEADDADRLSLNERQEQAAALGAEIVRGILERMGLEAEVNTRVTGGTVYVEVFGDEMGILIGRGGATLEALQELVRAGVQRRLKTRQALVVDVEAYWERRRTTRGREGSERRPGRGNQRRNERRSGNR